jgi:hypothetical protein
MELCGAKTRKGTPCEKTAGWGTSHVGVGRCRQHGGASPEAEVRGVVELAKREARVMGLPEDAEPHEALLRCIRITSGELTYMSAQVAELKSAMVSTMFGSQIHTWITARQQAMDRLVGYSRVAIAAGLAERQVKLAEQQGELLAQVIRGVLADLGVADHPEAPAVVRKHLTLVADSTA